jgi:hypothetical protein
VAENPHLLPAGTAQSKIMTDRPRESVSVASRWFPLLTTKVALTPVPAETSQQLHAFSVTLSEMIAYSHHGKHTRLKLTGRRMVLVEESTAQIDRLVRDAASQHNSKEADALLSQSN